jgi:hypothetical protein
MKPLNWGGDKREWSRENETAAQWTARSHSAAIRASGTCVPAVVLEFVPDGIERLLPQLTSESIDHRHIHRYFGRAERLMHVQRTG